MTLSQETPSQTNGQSSAHAHSNGYAKVNGHSNGNGYVTGNGYANGKGKTDAETVPVAICGMAMRLPGGIRDDAALYDFLVNKGDARSPTPKDRYNAEAYYNPHGKHGTIITKHGYFLQDIDLSRFDPSMFSFGEAEIGHLDPNQRLILEVVREAFERAGEKEWRGKPIGTYVGLFTEDWQEISHKDSNFYHPYRLMGSLDFSLANRISYEYDLKGPR